MAKLSIKPYDGDFDWRKITMFDGIEWLFDEVWWFLYNNDLLPQVRENGCKQIWFSNPLLTFSKTFPPLFPLIFSQVTPPNCKICPKQILKKLYITINLMQGLLNAFQRALKGLWRHFKGRRMPKGLLKAFEKPSKAFQRLLEGL